jgi:hypothetical protein
MDIRIHYYKKISAIRVSFIVKSPEFVEDGQNNFVGVSSFSVPSLMENLPFIGCEVVDAATIKSTTF